MTPAIAGQLSAEIGMVRAAIAGCDPRTENLLRVLLSDAIARKIRMRFLGTGVGRFALTFAHTPLPQIFARSLDAYVRVATTCAWLRETLHLQLAETQVLEADTRRIPDDAGRFDILVTSPPYLPASSGRESYARARAPSLIALGMRDHLTVDTLVDDAIGSMESSDAAMDTLATGERAVVEWLSRDPLRAIKAGPTARYFADMRRAFGEMHRVLSPGAHAVVVSGKTSTFYQFATRAALYVVPAAELLAEEARDAGFIVETLRDVQLVKSNRNARPRSLDDYYETLIFLRRP
jgi:methylase of polypeptide subunit release factors